MSSVTAFDADIYGQIRAKMVKSLPKT